MKNQITMIEAFPELFSGSEYERSEEEEMKAKEIIKNVLIKYVQEHGYSPTYREIMIDAGYNSLSRVSKIMEELYQEGFIETDIGDFSRCHRAYRLAGYKIVKVGGE